MWSEARARSSLNCEVEGAFHAGWVAEDAFHAVWVAEDASHAVWVSEDASHSVWMQKTHENSKIYYQEDPIDWTDKKAPPAE